MEQNRGNEYPYMGPRPGAPDAATQEQMAAAVRDNDAYNKRLKLQQAGGFPIGSPLTTRVTDTPESNGSTKLRPPTPPKSSTG